jgi:hypothetical protein
MLIQGQVGPITQTASISPGIQAPVRQGNMGEQVVSEYMGRYGEGAYRRQTFSIASQAATGITTSIALSGTFVGVGICNPAGSTINAHVLMHGYAFTVAPAAPLVYGLMSGVASFPGTVTPRNRYIGGAAGQVLATLGGTITGTMYVEQILAMANTQLAVASWMGQGITTIDLGGSIILPPGTCLCSYTNIAGGASGLFGSFVWQEIPI